MKKAQPTGCALVLEGNLSQLRSRSKRCNLARCCAPAPVSAKRLGSTWLESGKRKRSPPSGPTFCPKGPFATPLDFTPHVGADLFVSSQSA